MAFHQKALRDVSDRESGQYQYIVDEIFTGHLVDRIFGDYVADAILARPPVPKKGCPNATARFLDRRIRETGGLNGTFMSGLRRAVMVHLPVSATAGLVEDHVQNCFTRLIARDSLAQRLADGHRVSDQQVMWFAVQAGFTDVRDSGTNPVCREMYGARTEREREKGVVLGPITDPRVVWSANDDADATWMDIVDTASSPEDDINFAQLWGRLEDAIRSHKARAADRYIRILQTKVMGGTVHDIAAQEGVSLFRASSMMGEIRRTLRKCKLDDPSTLNG